MSRPVIVAPATTATLNGRISQPVVDETDHQAVLALRLNQAWRGALCGTPRLAWDRLSRRAVALVRPRGPDTPLTSPFRDPGRLHPSRHAGVVNA